MKISKKILALLLSALMLFSCLSVGTVGASAATGETQQITVLVVYSDGGYSNLGKYDYTCRMTTDHSGYNHSIAYKDIYTLSNTVASSINSGYTIKTYNLKSSFDITYPTQSLPYSWASGSASTTTSYYLVFGAEADVTYYDYYLSYSDNVSTETISVPSMQSYEDTTATSHTFTISSTSPVRSGYNFLGWSTNSSASYASYQPSGSISVSSSSTTLYAIWEKATTTYTVTYTDGVPGETVFATQTYTVNAGEAPTAYVDVSTDDSIPERIGFVFAGWNNGTTTYDSLTDYEVNADTTFTAQWKDEVVEHTVTVDGEAQTVVDGETIILPADPTKDGSIFTGWVDADGNPVTSETTVEDDMTVTSTWVDDENNNTIPDDTVVTYTWSQTVNYYESTDDYGDGSSIKTVVYDFEYTITDGEDDGTATATYALLSSDELADLDYPASIQMTTESGNEYTHHYNYYWSTASTWKNAAMIDYGYYTGTNYVLAQEMTSTYSETAADEINVYLVSKNGGSDEWYYTTVLHYGDYEYEYYLQGDFTDLGKIITIEEFIAATEMSEEDAITLRALVVDSEMVYYWTDYAGQEIKYNSHLYGSTNVDHLNEELGYDVSEYGATTHLYFTHTCDYVLDESQTVTATCQTEGKEVYVCSICGDEYIKNLGLDLNNHEGKIDGTYVAPTYEAKGYERMYYTCCDAEVSYKEYAQLNDNLIHVDESVDVNGDGYDDETGSIIAIYVNVYIGKSTATGEETETITKELFDKVLVPFAVVSFIVDGEYVIDLADLHPTALGVDLGEDYAWISYYSTSDTDDDNGIFDADTTETLTVIDGEEFVLVYVDMGDGEGGDGEDTGEVDPSIPDAGDDEEENDCDCICHSSNWFDQIIYKIVRLFWNIFDINKVCKCGKTYHYIT